MSIISIVVMLLLIVDLPVWYVAARSMEFNSPRWSKLPMGGYALAIRLMFCGRD